MRLTPLVTVTLALCSLAACASSGGGASAPAPAVVTPSAQVSASAPPPVPAPSTPATAEGAIAFIRAYYAELDRAQKLNDTRGLVSYSTVNCPCRAAVTAIVKNSERREHWTAHAQTIDSTRIVESTPNHIELLVNSHWPKTQLIGLSGGVVAVDPGHTAIERFVLDRYAATWRISVVYAKYAAVIKS